MAVVDVQFESGLPQQAHEWGTAGEYMSAAFCGDLWGSLVAFSGPNFYGMVSVRPNSVGVEMVSAPFDLAGWIGGQVLDGDSRDYVKERCRKWFLRCAGERCEEVSYFLGSNGRFGVQLSRMLRGGTIDNALGGFKRIREDLALHESLLRAELELFVDDLADAR